MSINKKWSHDNVEKYTSLDEIEDELKKENEKYICKHPEVRAMVRTLLHAAINRPPTNPAKLAANVFDLNTNALLKVKIDEERMYIVKELKNLRWAKHDVESLITKTSTHSMLSEISIFNEVDPILRFCLIMQRNK